MRRRAISPDCDVLVLGGGLAGQCAALAAAEAGAEVLLLEKQATPGGSTAMSGGSFAFAGTVLQAAHGIEDDGAALRDDLLRIGESANEPDLVDLFVARQVATFEWLRAFGVAFDAPTLSSGQSRPRTHSANPVRLLATLAARLAEQPRIRLLTGVAAERLWQDGGCVAGALIHRDGSSGEVAARRGVVLATGGFSRNARMIATFVPQLARAAPLGGPGNDGAGLRMAMALGADLADMGHVKGTFGVAAADPAAGRPEPGGVLLMALYRGAVIVNRDARRFTDEAISYKKIGDLCLRQTGALGFQVFDARIMAQTRPDVPVNDFRGGLERGFVHAGATLAAVARAAGLDPATLEATIARYNAGVRAGRDEEFGRDSLGDGYGRPVEIAEPPFYVFPCTTGVVATYAGLRVDARMRVRDVFGAPIAGLYAAGEIVGGLHGAGYMSGSSLTKSALFGRIAGQDAASAHNRGGEG